ncbi:MAG: sigma-70 family RNA polymerase sigma factor [Candidatus Nanopelagicales bacterium]|nr:sigma-70 family RNA polymerase sigma factor [Candidatus Nanopelagicales bacterium]MDZ4250153.1 sigma-70 family RNA polymerase sigma factor [Candidatus Nanopelagicales bacterium]
MRRRSADWFEDLYRRRCGAVTAYARRRVGLDGADEVVTDTFTVAWHKKPNLRLEDELPWLYATSAHSVSNWRRSQRRQSALFDRICLLQPSVDHLDPSLDAVETVSLVSTVLRGMSEADREVLLLVAWEDLSPAQLAVYLGCAEGAARTRVHRARHRFKVVWEQHNGPREPIQTPHSLSTT